MQNSWDLLLVHSLINAFAENLSSLKLNTTNVFLTSLNLFHEVTWDQEYNENEEGDQNLHLELSFLNEGWQSDSDGEGTLAIWVTEFLEVGACFFVSHNGVGLSNLDKFINSLWIVRIFIGMLIPGESAISLLDLCLGGIDFNTKDFIRNKRFQWLKILDDIEANVADVPKC